MKIVSATTVVKWEFPVSAWIGLSIRTRSLDRVTFEGGSANGQPQTITLAFSLITFYDLCFRFFRLSQTVERLVP